MPLLRADEPGLAFALPFIALPLPFSALLGYAFARPVRSRRGFAFA